METITPATIRATGDGNSGKNQFTPTQFNESGFLFFGLSTNFGGRRTNKICLENLTQHITCYVLGAHYFR